MAAFSRDVIIYFTLLCGTLQQACTCWDYKPEGTIRQYWRVFENRRDRKMAGGKDGGAFVVVRGPRYKGTQVILFT